MTFILMKTTPLRQRILRPLIVLAVTLSTPLLASAQSWYQFDVVIFQPRTNTSPEERPDPLVVHDIPDDALTLKKSGDFKEAFVELPESDSTLSSKMAALRKNYNILWNKSWRMPMADGSKTSILIQGGKTLDDTYQIEGTLTFYMRRYLHVASDLWINTLKSQSPAELILSGEAISVTEQAMLPYNQNRHFKAEQRLLPNKVIYLDNPDAGVVIKVTPWKAS